MYMLTNPPFSQNSIFSALCASSSSFQSPSTWCKAKEMGREKKKKWEEKKRKEMKDARSAHKNGWGWGATGQLSAAGAAPEAPLENHRSEEEPSRRRRRRDGGDGGEEQQLQGGRRDSGEGRRGARGRAAAAAAARRGGVLTAATVGGSTGEGLASLQHDRAMDDAAPVGERTVGSSGGPQRGRRLAVRRRAIEGIDAREIANEQQRRRRGGLSSGADGWTARLQQRRADGVARRRRCSQKGKQKRSFARHESSKGEIELMTLLKTCILGVYEKYVMSTTSSFLVVMTNYEDIGHELILNDIMKSKEEIRRFENAFWSVGRLDSPLASESLLLFICDMSSYLDAVDISQLSVRWGHLSRSTVQQGECSTAMRYHLRIPE
ncbi:hypothetical protein Scep_003332 [Stephania cephalantha]|uniref:Uncharacterized protein n=1 Tax=Stephania cephalantha TaxID=152367 RepID=A0AAP0PUC0_9MAGN